MILGLSGRSESYMLVNKQVSPQSATISDLAKRWTLVQVPLGACIAARGGSICCVLCGIVHPGLSTFYVDFHRCNDPRTGGSHPFNASPQQWWLGDWTGWQTSPPPLAWWAQVIFGHVPQNGLIFVRVGSRQNFEPWYSVPQTYLLQQILIYTIASLPTIPVYTSRVFSPIIMMHGVAIRLL